MSTSLPDPQKHDKEFWDRFNQRQREAYNAPENRWRQLVPKGVYRFKTWEEIDVWEEEWKRKAAELDKNAPPSTQVSE